MPTSRPFAYNTGSTLSNTAQYGNIAVLTGTTLPSGVQWWNGPDEDIGYVITSQNTSGNQPNPLGIPAYIQFNRTTSLNSTQFISLASLITGQNFTSAVEAEIYLKSNGYWTSAELTFEDIQAGSEISLGLTGEGILYSWGSNINGSLGDNSVIPECTPVSVCGNLTFTQISTGYNFSLGIATDGVTYAWGENTYGQLGTNNTISYSTPKAVCGGISFCQVSAGQGHSLGITTNGVAYAWGYGFFGGLGNNSILNRSTPVAVCGGLTFTQICSAYYSSHALTTNGIAYSWGYNQLGQLGNNTGGLGASVSTPVAVCGGLTFSELSTKTQFVVALTTSGIAYAWGNNQSGNLGDNSILNKSTPVAVCGGFTFKSISAGAVHSLAITTSGIAYSWGYNQEAGNLGDNSLIDKSTPVAVCGGLTFAKISAGWYFSLGTTTIGYTYGWGQSKLGQLGNNVSNLIWNPQQFISNYSFNNITAGGSVSLGLSGTTLFGWGDNSIGQLGNNSAVLSRESPVQVCGGLTFNNFATRGNTVLALTTGGLAYAWGANFVGGIGNNSIIDRSTPVAVCGGLTFCEIGAGQDFSTAILSSTGVAYAWGDNQSGQLGNNAIIDRSTPVAVCGGLSYSKISAGFLHTVALTRTGLAYAWGDNSLGQIGNNTIVNRSTPVAVCGGLTFTDVSCGSFHTLALTTTGILYSWGENGYGQLGNNTINERSTPVAVCGGLTFTQISTQETASYGITNTGVAYAWGSNSKGQLGTGNITPASTPVAILTGSVTFCKIVAGGIYALGLTSTGLCYGWGDNASGQLGLSIPKSVLTPVLVCQA